MRHFGTSRSEFGHSWLGVAKRAPEGDDEFPATFSLGLRPTLRGILRRRIPRKAEEQQQQQQESAEPRRAKRAKRNANELQRLP